MTNEKIVEMLEDMKIEQVRQGESIGHINQILQKMIEQRHEPRVQRIEDILFGHDNTSGLIYQVGKLEMLTSVQKEELLSSKQWVKGASFVLFLAGSILGYVINFLLK